MKKWMSIILVMVFILTYVMVGFAEEKNSATTQQTLNLEDPSTFLGDWYLITMEYDGLAMNAVDLGIKITLTLSEDGSATMLAEDDEEPQLLEWKINSKGLQIGEEEEWALVKMEEDGLLSLEDEDTKLVYQREKPVAEEGDFEDSPIIEGTEDGFIGQWTLKLVEADGLRLSVTSLGMEVTMTIKGDMLQMDIMGEVKSSTWKMMDGKLITESMELNLHENGMISIVEESGTVMWFVNEEKEEEPLLP